VKEIYVIISDNGEYQ